MPHQTRIRKTEQTLTTLTKDGEITINLNLNIAIEGGDIRIEANATTDRSYLPNSSPEAVLEKEKRKALEIVPTELFSQGDELIDGFGGKS